MSTEATFDDIFDSFTTDGRYIEPCASNTTDFYLFVLTFFIYYLKHHAAHFIEHVSVDLGIDPRDLSLRRRIVLNPYIHRIEANLQKILEGRASPYRLVSYPVRNIFHVEHTVSYLLHCRILFPPLPEYISIDQKDRVCTYVLDVGSYLATFCAGNGRFTNDHG